MMNRLVGIGCVALIGLCLFNGDLHARGGRGGGFSGGGGNFHGGGGNFRGGGGGSREGGRGGDFHGNGARGGDFRRNEGGYHSAASKYNFNRTPSFTASDFHPSQFQPTGNALGSRQGAFSNMPQAQTASQGRTQQQLQNFLTGNQSSPNLSNAAANAPSGGNLSSALSNRSQAGDAIRNNIGQYHPNNGNWFRGNFWNQHANPWGWGSGYNAWNNATWGGAAGWLAWNATNPAYYDSGYAYYPNSNNNGTTQSSSSQQQGSSSTSSQPSSSQTAQQSSSSSQTSDASSDWMPLGVYALTKEGNTTAAPSMYLQLALNKNGQLAGTYYNTTTDVTHPVEGTTDQNTEQVALKMSDNDSSPILQTGLYNLTQDQTPVQVNFPDGSTQDWFMVRMQQQQQQQQSA